MKVGKVKELYRYPVKSMGGEPLRQSIITEHGIVGDRTYALQRESSYLHAQKYPELLSYKAEFKLHGDQYGVTVTSPSGKIFDWEDEQLIEEMSDKFGGTINRVTNNPYLDRGTYWEEPILLVSTSSLEKVSELWGKGTLDARRFRPNIIIELESKDPFEEEQWFGKQLSINDALFTINKSCFRCAYINIDPTNVHNRDSTVLKTVVKERNNNLGVYASVDRLGTIFEGADVLLL